MTETTITIETDDGARLIGDVVDFNVEVETMNYGPGTSLESKEFQFEVGILIDTDTGEEY